VSGFEPAEELKMKEKLRQFLNLEVNMIRNSDSSSVIVLDL
jgi:hypothetical protein